MLNTENMLTNKIVSHRYEIGHSLLKAKGFFLETLQCSEPIDYALFLLYAGPGPNEEVNRHMPTAVPHSCAHCFNMFQLFSSSATPTAISFHSLAGS